MVRHTLKTLQHLETIYHSTFKNKYLKFILPFEFLFCELKRNTETWSDLNNIKARL